jgi:hypothetical protein
MLGVATLAFYTVLTLAAATDVTATTFGVSVNGVVQSFRALAILAPPIAGFVAYRLCKELQARDIARGIPVPNPQPPPRRSGWRPPPRPDRAGDGGDGGDGEGTSETTRENVQAVEP